jgi:hypothetical protein
MDRFVAPQFIDVEDKIIGPITTRQFIMMVGGGIIVFIAYKILDTSGFAVVAFLTAILVVVFGFVKINGRRFHEFVKSIIDVLRRPRVRVWHKHVTAMEVTVANRPQKIEEVKTDFQPKKRIRPKKLRDLALIVDTGGKFQG